MRKTLNLIALAMLISTNVLTPFTYAQFEEEVVLDNQQEILPNEEDGATKAQETVPESKEDETLPELVGENLPVEEIILEENSVNTEETNLPANEVLPEDDENQEDGEEIEDDESPVLSAISVVERTLSIVAETYDVTYELNYETYGANKLTEYKDVNGVTIPLLDRNLGAGSVGDTGFYYKWGTDSEGTVGTREAKSQGPCPTGYHVPTIEEWSSFIISRCETEDVCDLKQLEQKEYRSSDLLYSWEISGELGDNKNDIINGLSSLFPIVGSYGYDNSGNGSLKENKMDQTILWASDPVTETNHDNQPHNEEGGTPGNPGDTQARGFYFSNHARKGGWAGVHESDIYEGNQVRCISDDYKAPTIMAIDIFTGEYNVNTGMTIDNENWVSRKFIEKTETLSEDTLSLPEVEDRKGYEWKRYLIDGTELDINTLDLTDVSDLKIYGYYEAVKSIEYEEGNITYTDTNGKVFTGIGTITIISGDQSITMLDRNLGATSNDIDNADSYGYHFQWGNNHGFAINDNCTCTDYRKSGVCQTWDCEGDLFPGGETTSGNMVDASGYAWNKPYVSSVFIMSDDYGAMRDSSKNYNLRGGEGSEDYMRQGPCPAGYHVPTSEEVKKLYKSLSSGMGPDSFNIPSAGCRSNSDAGVYFVGDEAKLWCSSNDGYDYVETWGSDYYRGDLLYGIDGNGSTFGQSVRCFKDNYEQGEESIILSYDTRGGTAVQAQTLAEGMTGYLPGYTTHKTGAELVGRYYEDLITPFDLENTILTADTTIYAKWSNDHTVKFVNYDDSIIEEIVVQDGDELTAPNEPTRDGYIFAGWYDGDSKVSFPYPVLEDKTLKANWTEKKSSTNGGGYSGGGSSKSTSSSDKNDDKKDTDTKKAEPEIKKDEGKNIKIITDAPVNTEKETFNAHQWAYTNGLTKYRTTSEARMDDFLNRSEMAKISSIFAMQFLDKTPNLDKKEFCSQYSDMWKVEDDMKFFITESCELGYMGYESNGIDALERFRPYTPLTVAETATILSRIVWGNENAMNGKDWYKGHLYATYNNGLIDDIKDPTTRSITRREAYTMLYRLMNVME